MSVCLQLCLVNTVCKHYRKYKFDLNVLFLNASVLKSNQLIGIFTIKAQDGGHRSDRSCSVVEDVVHIVVQCRGREERDEQQEKEEQEVWAAPALWALFPRPRATRPTSALLHSFLEHCNVSITIEISIELFLITHSAFY